MPGKFESSPRKYLGYGAGEEAVDRAGWQKNFVHQQLTPGCSSTSPILPNLSWPPQFKLMPPFLWNFSKGFICLWVSPHCKPHGNKVPILQIFKSPEPTQYLVNSRHLINICEVDVIEFSSGVSFLVFVEYHWVFLPVLSFLPGNDLKTHLVLLANGALNPSVEGIVS